MSEPAWKARFTGGYGPVTADMVEAAERRLGVTLPSDYQQFLITTNGGTPEPTDFIVPGRGPAIASILYGLQNDRTDCGLEYEQEQATLWDPLPPGYIAIGHDPGGSSLLMATLGKSSGRIMFWDRNGLWVRDDGRNTFPVAATFTQFLQSLRDFAKVSQRQAMLFSVACCRHLWAHSKPANGLFWRCLDVAERLADGKATEREAESAEQMIVEVGGPTCADWGDVVLEILTREAEPLSVVADTYGHGTDDLSGISTLLRDIVAPVILPTPQASWLTWNSGAIPRAANAAYEEHSLPSGHLDNARLAVLADMLEEAGCRDTEVLRHLRMADAVHVRGCFALDLLLGKE